MLLDSGKVVNDMAQRHLETSLPKSGGRVVVVMGKYKNQRGIQVLSTSICLAVQNFECKCSVQLN